jgi:hypothetical protein
LIEFETPASHARRTCRSAYGGSSGRSEALSADPAGFYFNPPPHRPCGSVRSFPVIGTDAARSPRLRRAASGRPTLQGSERSSPLARLPQSSRSGTSSAPYVRAFAPISRGSYGTAQSSRAAQYRESSRAMPSCDFCRPFRAPRGAPRPEARRPRRRIGRSPWVRPSAFLPCVRRIYRRVFRMSTGLRSSGLLAQTRRPRMRFVSLGPGIRLRLPPPASSRTPACRSARGSPHQGPPRTFTS